MRRRGKGTAALLCAALVLSMCLGSTMAWQSLSQTARNDTRIEGEAPEKPVIEKIVEGPGAPQRRFEFLLRAENGGPMPEGSTDGVKRLYLDGSGTVELGTFNFTEPGEYIYTVTEAAGNGAGWTYDATQYTLKYIVVEIDGELEVRLELTRNGGEPANRLVFRNKYTPPDEVESNDNVLLSGEKIWVHGNNPEENWPESVVVYVYADGKLVHQRLVTVNDDWKYSFLLPKYERNREIVYTVGEQEVPGYALEIDGYNLINTYVAPEPTPTPETSLTPEPTPTPGENSTPEPTPPEPTPPPPIVVKTGDTGELNWWIGVTVSGVIGLALCLGYLGYSSSKRRYVGKRLMKK